MAIGDWNWKHPVNIQDYPWDCSAASLAWALSAYGRPTTEQEVIAGLGPERISPSAGLLDASGAGLVAYLAELGIPAQHDDYCSWEEIVAAAGHQPMVMGGREWCHWTGVRMAPPAAGVEMEDPIVILANPAPGYYDIFQYITAGEFEQLGTFSAVWFPA